MSAETGVGMRLSRAGGWGRFIAIASGAGIAVVLLTLAWELPDAMYPISPFTGEVPAQRGVISGLLVLIIAPVIALLLTVGRLSAEVRDRRLGALSLLGLRRGRVLRVAAAEIAFPTVVGAVLGAAAYAALAPVLTAVVGPNFRAPLALTPRLAVVACAVVALSMLLSLAPVRRLNAVGRAVVSEATPIRPSLWRLTPVAVAIVLEILVIALPVRFYEARVAALVGGALAAMLAVVLVTPLITTWLAGGMVRAREVPTLLAGRSIQTQGPSITRRVSALGVTVMVALVATGWLGYYESIPYLASAIHEVEQGPQEIYVADPGSGFPERLVADLEAIDGVQGVIERLPLDAVAPMSPGPQTAASATPTIFTGTCAQLALVASVTGCSDTEAAWISRENVGDLTEYYGWNVDVANSPRRAVLQWAFTGDYVVLEPTGLILQDIAATRDRWLLPGEYDLFIPPAVLAGEGLNASGSLLVIADVGAQVAADVAAVAEHAGISRAYPSAMVDYRPLMQQRVVVATLVATSIGVALLATALASIDRARIGRRDRARLVAVGVPAPVLRRSQALGVAVPLLACLAIALVGGWGLLGVFVLAADGNEVSLNEPALIGLSVAAAAGAVVVSMLTLPLTRDHVRPEDLRQE